jgi:hypothetical protein
MNFDGVSSLLATSFETSTRARVVGVDAAKGVDRRAMSSRWEDDIPRVDDARGGV